ncbi:hypothetical protein O1611_g1543 [Lasiodiplodia mahajangana]|uniref:Uncharacterized protein n=1 Tax=Lasiodiplodia mahajangana TaxID=1108764 RepID=A0ACC2JXN0_9PEZI|nr:hypothetical protein O1611_g1543 [Lasiodiplodia mahajangana]
MAFRRRLRDEETAILLTDRRQAELGNIKAFYKALFHIDVTNESREIADWSEEGNEDDDPMMVWYCTRLERKYAEAIHSYCIASGETPDSIQAPAISIFTYLARVLGRERHASLEALSWAWTFAGANREHGVAMHAQLVFQLVGHLSFLYSPRFDEHGQGRLGFQVDQAAASRQQPSLGPERRGADSRNVPWVSITAEYKQSLGDILRSLGGGVPQPSFPSLSIESSDSERNTVSDVRLNVLNLNYYTLNRLADITIMWTDSVWEHLDFNANKKEIKLFRYPSFCVLMATRNGGRTFLCRLFNDHLENSHSGTGDTLVSGHFFAEILYSYRLIFGQTRHARRAFADDYLGISPFGWFNGFWRRCFSCRRRRREYSTSVLRDITDDPLLRDLCGLNWADVAAYKSLSTMNVKNVYSATRDFPYLGKKLSVLHDFVEAWEPDSMKDLWRDRRNLNRYYTMRLLMVTVAMSVIFGIGALAIGIAQIFYNPRHG